MRTADPNSSLDNRSYYDDFAQGYEGKRHLAYHRMLDNLEIDVVRRFGLGRDVLEAGCGTGLLLERTRAFARHAIGIDLSSGMLERARQRGLEVVQASVTELPFADKSFDVTYSFKVLAHIDAIEQAMRELARVTRPGGYVLAEFYNRNSLRYLVKRTKPPEAISAQTTDDAVFTRYDTPADVRAYLPKELAWRGARGIRILTPISHAHQVPVVGKLLRGAESALADIPIIRELAGFYVAIAQRV